MKVWQRPTLNWKLECENTPGKTLAEAMEMISVESEKPWIEFQTLINNRKGWVLYPMVPIIFLPLHPIVLGPLNVGLMLRPIQLANQIIGMLESEDPFGNSAAAAIPPWFNSCLEQTSQVPLTAESFAYDGADEIHSLRVFAAIATVFSVFTCLSVCVFWVYIVFLLCCH